MRLLALFFLCLFALIYCPTGNRAGWFGSVYKITINGTIKYHGKPVEGAKVTLWDDDGKIQSMILHKILIIIFSFTPFQDPLQGDKYQEMVTGKDGNFLLHGEEKEINGIEPFLEIWHNCVPDTWDPKYENGLKFSEVGWDTEIPTLR